MKKLLLITAVISCLMGFTSVETEARSPVAETNQVGKSPTLAELKFTTAAYQREALRLLISEANLVAQELGLPERLPITNSDLTEIIIHPPRAARIVGLGNISTSNYVYYISVGHKFSGLDRKNLEQDWEQLRKNYTWPISRMDTNGAFQMATQIMAAVSMDVAALNRDCRIDIQVSRPDDGLLSKHFVPDYWVTWFRPGQNEEAVAMIEFLLPTRTIRQLHVNNWKYILRKPVKVQHADALLSQTNAMPLITNKATRLSQ